MFITTNKKLFLFCIFLFLSYTFSSFANTDSVMIIKVSEQQSGEHRDMVLKNVTLSAGSYIERKALSTTKNAPYELQVLSNDLNVIHSQYFNFIRHIEVPLPEPGKAIKNETPRVAIDEPEAVIIIPNLPKAVFLRLKGPEVANLPITVPIDRLKGPLSDSTLLSLPTSQNGKLDILILASGYTEMSSFQNRAMEVKNYILSAEPFSNRMSDITITQFENTENLGCYTGCFGIDRLMCCSGNEVMSAALASGHSFDEIIVIHNTSIYAGGGYRDYGNFQDDSASSYCMIYDGEYSASMALHELGHSFGNLCDEYSYGSEGYSYEECVNCRPSCSDWSGISSGCQLSCDARTDFYRPEDSIMLTLSIPTFNGPSIYKSLLPRINYFAPPEEESTEKVIVPMLTPIILSD